VSALEDGQLDRHGVDVAELERVESRLFALRGAARKHHVLVDDLGGVLAKYRDDILDGLLGRMMTQPNKPYTNSQLAIFHMRKFVQACASARVEWQRNNTYRTQAWAFPGGFSGGTQRGRSSGWGGPV